MRASQRYEPPAYVSADPLIARFVQHLELRKTSPRTVVAYQRDLENFGSFLKATTTAAPLEEHQAAPYERLGDAQPADVLQYQRHLTSSRSYAPRSIRRKLAALRTFYKFLRFDGRRTDNPALDAPLPKIGRPLPKALSTGEISKVLSLQLAGLTDLQRLRDRAILECLYSSGLRRSELLKLDIADVSFERRMIRVIAGKGNKDRNVPMNPEAAAAMQAYLGVRPATPDPAFFVGRGGRRLSESGVYKIVRTYMQISGIAEHASPHTIRHSIATHLYENGADLLFLKEFLGHESVATTEIYTKVSQARMHEQFDAMHPRKRIDDPEEPH